MPHASTIVVKRVSPAMVHSYFDYMLNEYPRGAAHGVLLVQQHVPGSRLPWATEGARKMVARAGERAGLGRIRPHAFRHSFTTAVLEASGGDLVIARDAGAGRQEGLLGTGYDGIVAVRIPTGCRRDR